MLFRLSNTKEYADMTEIGNRLLSVFVGIGHYVYSTYDITSNSPALKAKLPYDIIEGEWVYIY